MIETPKPPRHLRAATRRWFRAVLRDFELDDHHIKLLTLASQAWDRAEDARLAIAREGMTYVDRFGSPKARPEIAIERDSRIAFARLLREVGLDSATVSTPRPFALRQNDLGRKKVS